MSAEAARRGQRVLHRRAVKSPFFAMIKVSSRLMEESPVGDSVPAKRSPLEGQPAEGNTPSERENL